MQYAQHVSKEKTPQTEQAHADQVVNNAGGHVFAVDMWGQLDRFLILGAEGGTYYASERKLTRGNAKSVEACLRSDVARTLARIVEISDSGRAPKNDPAIFALALAATVAPIGDVRAALPRVCRTGTHLFHFAAAVNELRGWGRGLRGAVADWYHMPADDLAHQVAKYQQRDGWAHRDLLRLAHAKPATPEHNAIFRWCVGGLDAFDAESKKGQAPIGFALPRAIMALEEAKRATSKAEIIRLILEDGLTHEMVPNEWKHEADVWAALLVHMPMGAMVRNLGKMTAVGLLTPMSEAGKVVAERLANMDRIRKARLHPISLLSALRVYQQGHGERGKLGWSPNPDIVGALDAAFYLAFGTVEPSGKNTLIALDVSGSMAGTTIAGVPGLDARVASAAMAMVTLAAEHVAHVVGFTAAADGRSGGRVGGDPSLTAIDLKGRRLDDAVATVARLQMGGTDCSLPMRWAQANGADVDTFVVYTDNETWAGPVHPFQALRSYRQKSGRAAKLIVVAMAATPFTIADPSDAGMLDVVGFDSAAPQVMVDFARGSFR